MSLLPLRTILVPTDCSEGAMHALREALDLAGVTGASLRVVYVSSVYEGAGAEYELDFLTPEVFREMEERARARLAKWLEGVETGKVPTTSTTRQGRTVDELLAEAQDCGADLIVMSTHGRTGFRHALIGSVTERVVRLAPCPVLSIRHPDALRQTP